MIDSSCRVSWNRSTPPPETETPLIYLRVTPRYEATTRPFCMTPTRLDGNCMSVESVVSPTCPKAVSGGLVEWRGEGNHLGETAPT